MSEKKIISINPELFALTNNTKKNKPKNKDNIKVKSPAKNKNSANTLRKKSILKMIREQQQKQNVQQFSNQNYKHNNKNSEHNQNSELEEAKKFFDNMVIAPVKKHNVTLKQSPSNIHSPTQILHNNIQTHPPIEPVELTSNVDNTLMNINKPKIDLPKYGCLKNGSLPTYRDYLNKTRKNLQSISPSENTISPSENIKSENNKINNYELSDTFKKGSVMLQHEKLNNLKKQKQQYKKKIIRRTYKIGKSKIKPSVSVLISNKTIRNNITEKKQLLNQISISEIRKYLIQQGLIKVGSITPNDLLRKMYESAILICGEVQNHNKDTLMYNYIHAQS